MVPAISQYAYLPLENVIIVSVILLGFKSNFRTTQSCEQLRGINLIAQRHKIKRHKVNALESQTEVLVNPPPANKNQD